MSSKPTNSKPDQDNVVPLRQSSPIVDETPKKITSPEDFLKMAQSLLDFERDTVQRSTDSAEPAARVTGLDGLVSSTKTVKLQDKSRETEDPSTVATFPGDRDEPPSSRNK